MTHPQTETTSPSPSSIDVKGALKAPLLAYAATVVAAIAFGALILAALLLGSESSVSDTGVSKDDASGLGFIVGLPIQLASMALFGVLEFSAGDAGVTFFMLPLILTGVFCLTAFRVARASELTRPAASSAERAAICAVGGLVTAVVVTFSTWALAMRYDGSNTNAAGVGLFVGTLFVSTAAAYLGRASAAGLPQPRGVMADYAAAAALWVHHLALFALVFIPVLFVWTWVEGSFAAAVATPTIAINAAAYGYALGSLSSVEAFGQNFFVWTADSLVEALVLIALVTAVSFVAALAWHLRRDRRAEHLATTGSWFAVPAIWAVGALVLWLAPTIQTGFAGLSGTIQPAFYLVFILPLWGLAIEAASRFVAPAVLDALPPAVARRLDGPSAASLRAPDAAAVGSEATGSAPPTARERTPEESARLKRFAIAGGAIAGLGLAGFLTVSVLSATVFSPKGAAADYLDAVSTGDLSRVLDLTPVTQDASGAMLTQDVLDEASASITGYEITEVDESISPGEVVVSVELDGLDGESEAELVLEEDGSRGVFFKNYRVKDAGLLQQVEIDMPEGASMVSVGEAEVDLGTSTTFWALPGTYSFDPFGQSKWLDSAETATIVEPTGFGTYAELPEPAASEALLDAINVQVTAHLDTCLATTQIDPDNCPNSTFTSDNIRKVRWSIAERPTVELSYFDGTFPADVELGDARATVTYEEDLSYGFGPAQWTPVNEEVDLYFGASVDLQDDEPVVTFDDF